MGFKEKIQNYYMNSYMKKYGERITQVQGNVISVKIEEKTILWIFHKLSVILLIRPERSKGVVKCYYKKNRWFKRVDFMSVSQGNLVIIQGLKGKKGKGNREQLQIINIRNLSTKKDLVKTDEKVKKVQKVQQRFK